MDKISFFPDNLDIANKKVIIRLDFNVPIKNKLIQDVTRIELCLPFIKKLIEKKAKIIIISHLGRPNGVKVPELSLFPVYSYLKKSIETNIDFYNGNFDSEIEKKVLNLKSGEIIFLENIRFFQEESDDDEIFSKKIGSLGDIYINDAFSCSHRKQASIHKITKFIKRSYGGPLLKKEINSINLVIQSNRKPITCIIGGSKVSTKINVISSLLKKVDNLIIVGAMANNFFLYKNLNVGKSLIEKNSISVVKEIYKMAENYNCKIIIPDDCVVAKNRDGNGINKVLDDVEDNDMILDIGSKTIKNILEIINQSKTVLWNGPAGYFENSNFINGTLSIANIISSNTKKNSLISILGGGDTVAAINKSKEKLFFTHLSTAGGAFLEYLEGKDLPGLSVLK